MTIAPRLDYVVLDVEKQKDTTTTKSGILVVKNAAPEDRQQIGNVLAVGEGRILEDGRIMPINLKAGQKVLFNKYAGTEIKVDEKSYLLIHEREIIAIVE